MVFVNPRNNWDRITPEFPRAPRREPDEIAFARSFITGFSTAATSLAAEMIVMLIFVPVSPSGTGNTFSSLIHSFFASRFFAPAKNIFDRSAASIVCISTLNSSLINDSDTFYEDIDLLNLHAGEFFHFIFYCGNQII